MNKPFDPVAFAQEHLPKLMKAVRAGQFQWTEMPPDDEHPQLRAFQGIGPDYTVVVGQGEGVATYLAGFVFFHLPPELAVEIYQAATGAMN